MKINLKISRRRAAAIISIVAIVIAVIVSLALQPNVYADPPKWRGKQWEDMRGWVNLYNITITVTASPLSPLWVTIETNGKIIDFEPVNLPFDELGNKTTTIGPIWPSGRLEILIGIDIPVDVELHYNITVCTPLLSVGVGT